MSNFRYTCYITSHYHYLHDCLADKNLLDHQINQQLSSMNISLHFTHYGEHDEMMAVIVTDKDTGKDIRVKNV